MTDDLISRDDALALPRYDPQLTGFREDYAGMEPCEDGDWVSVEAIAAIPAIDLAAIREAALREAMDACTDVIKNIEILKADGETYETPRIQKIARGLVSFARQKIEDLIGETK